MLNAVRSQLRSVAMLAVAGALVVGGVAVAQDDSSGTSQGSQQAGKKARSPGSPSGGMMMPLKGLTYGEFHVRTKSGEDKVIRVDQGKVSAVSESSITVTENDGNDVTIALDEDTEVVGKPGAEVELADLEGQQVTVSGESGAAADVVAAVPKKGDLPKGEFPKGEAPKGVRGDLPAPPGMQLGSE